MIVNPCNYAIRVTPGSTVENNLIVNGIGWAIDVYTSTGDFAKMSATIKNNTVVFTWTFKEPGKGAYQGTALHLNGPAEVTGNIFAWGDNHGIYSTIAADKVSLTNNVFFMNLFSNVKSFIDHKDVIVDDGMMDLLEEVGFKAYDGNTVANPGLAVDKAWLDKVSKRTAAVDGKVAKTEWNTLRSTLGMDLIGTGGAPASGIAPPYALDAALELLSPKVQRGARKQKLEVKLQGASAAAPQKSYEKVELASWASDASKVNGKAIEMVVAIGGTANVSAAPAQYVKDEHAATYLYPEGGQGTRVTAFYRKGSAAQREAEDLNNH